MSRRRFAYQEWKNYYGADHVKFVIEELVVPDDDWPKLMAELYDSVAPKPLEEFREFLKSIHYSEARIAEEFDERMVIKRPIKTKMPSGKEVRKQPVESLPRIDRRCACCGEESGRRFINCPQCVEELPDGQSPAEWARLNVGLTAEGVQVWCVHHDVQVVQIALGDGPNSRLLQ
jgi:cyclophilin family peptidyl-prolyl cis-trans isomerase